MTCEPWGGLSYGASVTTTTETTAPPTVDEFRARAREWLAANADTLAAREGHARMLSRETRISVYDAGFGGIAWPVEYGGLGLSATHQEAFTEEAAKYPALMVGDLVTVGICAPTLLDFGTEEQKRRYIPHMLRGDEIWTQLLSEPGAGSDLAGLQTRAVRDGDEWVVNGQKVWTSGAQWSEFAIMIARTNSDVPKHQGLSMFVVDLKAPGVTIRPLKQITGNDEFNEVFLDDVRLPAGYLVGAENDGWRALLRMLMHERLAIGAGTSGARMGRDMFTTLRELAIERGVLENEGVRAALLDLYVKEQLLNWLGQRMRDGAASGKEPGPEGSLAKLLNAIVSKASSNAGMLIGGPGSQAWDPSEDAAGELAAAFLQAPMTAIAGGTSEIQRNTIGERVLGLPKEPQLDRDVPFRDVLQNPLRKG
jgi:alkylation response protein AidB-like acyl-CoA dehydrogenase